MYNYYCKKCDNIIGEWNNEFKYYNIRKYCYFLPSQNNYFIEFLNCNNCKKFVGIVCYNVCKYCFGENLIFGEEHLFNFFLKYKKIIKKYSRFDYFCNICENKKFRIQYWFFNELTFHK